MNAYMNIRISVMSVPAQKKIAALEAQLASLQKQVIATNAAGAAMGGGALRGLTKWGNQVQWAGRQLTYNFTLPIVLAGAAATKFALDNEKAMVRVRKVYGDTSMSVAQMKSETDALGKAFTALSSKFGIAQADAINIGADWAAAGASGFALAKSVELTMETMVLGEMDAVEATEALIAIQAQYGFEVKDLARTIDILNMTENQTGISMKGLVVGFQKAAGVARTAGIDVEHLAAMMAALVPASGSAANAGNALKTIISRLLSPTGEAAEVMDLMGINTKKMAWQSLNGSQRLESLAKSFEGLDDAQKAAVSSTIASRWQINRFDVLMRDITNDNGYYQKSLESTKSAQDNFNQRVRELNAVLESNPQKLKQIWTILQNAMADVIQPMIPIILLLSAQIAKAVRWFQSLSPEVQKFAMFALLAVAALGPILRYLGAFATMLAYVARFVVELGKGLWELGKAMVWLVKAPFRLMIAAVQGLMWVFGLLGPAIAVALGAVKGLIIRVLGPTLAVLAAQARLAIFMMGRQIVATAGAVLPKIIPTMMLWWRTILTAAPGVITQALAYIYVFFVVQVPAAISRAYRPVFAASVRVWMAMTAALAATGPQILAFIDLIYLRITSFIARMFARVYAASLIAFSGITAAMTTTMAKLKRVLLMLPALMVWAMRLTGAALVTGMTRLYALMIVGMGRLRVIVMAGFAAIPRLAVMAWSGVLASVKILRTLGPAIIAALASPWTYVIALVIGLVYAFRNKLGEIWNIIVQTAIDAFWALPEGVRGAMIAVVETVKKAAMAVYQWFSFLNPFARHSPSLVDQVTEGMAVIREQYASVANVGSAFKKAAKDLAAFKNAIKGLTGGEWGDERADVAKQIPKALPLFDALVGDLKALNTVLAQQQKAVDAQQAVVDKWALELKVANTYLDQQEAKLDSLQATLDSLTSAYEAHQNALEAYADAPLQGMGAMEDAIFANQQAQNELRLEMLKWEEVNGSIEDVQNNMARLAGTMEQLRGEEASLRAAGAGSDVLGPIQNEIAAMQTAYDAMGTTVNNSPVNQMQEELARLGREGEILDLEKSVQFDPMIREIEKLANATEELSFEQIVAGIKSEQAAMDALAPQIAAATAAVNAQAAAVAAAKAARDAIQVTYDAENAKLDLLNDKYQQTETMIRDIENALNDLGSAASASAQKAADAAQKTKDSYMSPGAENFLAGKGGNFPDVGGEAKIGREGGLGDQSAEIEKFTADLNKQIEDAFGKFDMFGPIKEKWNQFTAWFKTNISDKLAPIGDIVKGVFAGIGDWFQNSAFVKFFKDDLQTLWGNVQQAFSEAWDKLKPHLERFKDLVEPLKKLWDGLWPVIKVVAGIIGGVLLLAFKVIASVISHTVGPAIDIIISIIGGVIEVIRGIVEFITGVFTGDLDLAIQGVLSIFHGLIDGIVGIFSGAWDLIWGVVEGLINGVIDWFWYMYDIVIGHSIIPDMINAIVDWFKKLPGWVWDALIKLKDKLIDVATKAWTAFTTKSAELWKTFSDWVGGLAQKAWDKIISIKDKLTEAARQAWQGFKDKATSIWNTTVTWITGLPQKAWDSIKDIVTKLGTAGKNAAQALWDKMKDIVDGKNGVITWVTGLPGRVADAMKSIGTKVADAVKGAWNGAAKWINTNGIAAVNKVTSKFGWTINDLPTFARGGVIPGKVSATDNTIIAARTGEGVIVPQLVAALGGSRGLNAANAAAASGNHNALRNMGIEGYADGGIIGKVTGWLQSGVGSTMSNIIGAFKQPVRNVIPGQPFMEDWTVGQIQGWQDAAKKWGKKQDDAGAGVLAPGGYQNQIKVLKKQFPNAVITSSFRPGAITALGNHSMHGMGRAIDIAPQKAIFEWIRSTYGKNTKQLFWSPEDGRTLLNGANWNMDPVTKRDHWDHIHWGYDKGGILPPGMTMARNGTGRNEITLTASQWDTFSSVVALLDTMTLKSGSGATPGAAAVARVGATLATVQGRLRQQETRATTWAGSGETTVYNFYGDLEFPNVKDGSDAEDFLKNLKGLGG
jgi:TP901 family phage tail tape measure protein